MDKKLEKISKLLDKTLKELEQTVQERRVILITFVNKYNDIWEKSLKKEKSKKIDNYQGNQILNATILEDGKKRFSQKTNKANVEVKEWV